MFVIICCGDRIYTIVGVGIAQYHVKPKMPIRILFRVQALYKKESLLTTRQLNYLQPTTRLIRYPSVRSAVDSATRNRHRHPHIYVR